MRIKSFITAAAVIVLGTIGFAQTVTYDYDRGADFSKYQTYAWVSGATVSDPINHQHIVRAIDSQLAAKGLRRLETPASADLLVAYHAAFERSLEINGFSSGWGGYRFAGSRSGYARAEEILVGTLAIDLVDARAKTIVWRGMATRDVDVNARPEKRDRNIQKAAEKIFKQYPPQQ